MQLVDAATLRQQLQSRPVDRRMHRRVDWSVRVRGLSADGEEFEAMTVDVCAGGLRISLAQPLQLGEHVVLYIDEIGRVEGRIARVLRDFGYAIAFTIQPRKRDKIADQLTWLINRDRLGLSDERQVDRRPGRGQVIATYGAGVSIACAISDVSLFGVALKTNGPRPLIGEQVTVGERTGACIRYIDGGFAVDFRTIVAD